MTAKKLPPVDLLRSMYAYDPASGTLISRQTGKAITSKTTKGYLQVRLLGSQYLAHRVVWTIFHGGDPGGWLDHINGIRHDNRIKNLRRVTSTQNARNRGVSRSNTSGVTGVRWLKSRKKWSAQIYVNRTQIYLGLFLDINDAKEAYRQASLRLHGEFGRVASDADLAVIAKAERGQS